MLRIDDRAGSRELYNPLVSLGLKVEMTRLPYGDIEFEGRGEGGIPVLIGIEHKQVSDVIKCIQDGRFAGHQLPGLISRFDRVYLMVEGQYRYGPGGVLQVLPPGHNRYYDQKFGQRIFYYKELNNWLDTMSNMVGVQIKRATDQGDTAAQILSMYGWWTNKAWDEHKAHLALDEVTEACRVAILTKPSLTRMMAKELPGIGYERSADVASKFATPIDMVSASYEEWCSIPGIGKTTAKRIMEVLGSWGVM